jgi:hypothetical protein
MGRSKYRFETPGGFERVEIKNITESEELSANDIKGGALSHSNVNVWHLPLNFD